MPAPTGPGQTTLRKRFVLTAIFAWVSFALTLSGFAQTGPGQFKLIGNKLYVSRQIGTEWVWDLSPVVDAAEGGTIRLSADGSVNTYHPTEPTAVARYTALRTAVAAAIDHDTIIPDSRVIYEYDGNAIILSGRTGVTIHDVTLRRPTGVTYPLILQMLNCIDCVVDGAKFDGESGLQFDNVYPLTLGQLTASNPNALAQTYVFQIVNGTRCTFRNCKIHDHAGLTVDNGFGYPQMQLCYGFVVTGTDNRIEGCHATRIGYSGIIDSGDGTKIDNCLIADTGWHGLSIAGTGTTTVTNTILSASEFRAMGPRGATCDINPNSSKYHVTFDKCTFRYPFDWLKDMAVWQVGNTFQIGDYCYSNNECYEAIATSLGGPAPVGKVDQGNWKWLMPYSSQWLVKGNELGRMVLNDCKIEHGRLGDAAFGEGSIKLETNLKVLELNNCQLDGRIFTNDNTENHEIVIRGGHIQKTSPGFYPIYGSLGLVDCEDVRIEYNRVCFYDSEPSNGISHLKLRNCLLVPKRFDTVNHPWTGTSSNVCLSTHISDGTVDIDDCWIVDNTDESRTRHGTGNHNLSDTPDARLFMSGTTTQKLWDGTLTGSQSHSVRTGNILSAGIAYGRPGVLIRNKNWTGLGDVLDWSFDSVSSLWVPHSLKTSHLVTGLADATPDVSFATSCETPGDGTTITDFDWSLPIPTGWLLQVSIAPTDSIASGTGTIDFGAFGTGPGSPWTPAGGGYMLLRYDGTSWIRLSHQ